MSAQVISGDFLSENRTPVPGMDHVDQQKHGIETWTMRINRHPALRQSRHGGSTAVTVTSSSVNGQKKENI